MDWHGQEFQEFVPQNFDGQMVGDLSFCKMLRPFI